MRYLRPLLALLSLAALPAAAFASTPASQSQRGALLRAFGDSGVPARCLTTLVSTTDRSFAEVYFTGLWGAGQPVPAGCGRYAANGVTIFHYSSGHWRFVTAGSSFVTGTGSCGVLHVPTPVVEDFGLCGSLKVAPGMTAPSRARIGSRITVHAAGLQPGTYTLLLAVLLTSGGGGPITCSARVGSARAGAGIATISGRLPRRLTCRIGVGPAEGQVTVHPGRYVLSLGVLVPPAGFRGGSFVKRTIMLD